MHWRVDRLTQPTLYNAHRCPSKRTKTVKYCYAYLQDYHSCTCLQDYLATNLCDIALKAVVITVFQHVQQSKYSYDDVEAF